MRFPLLPERVARTSAGSRKDRAMGVSGLWAAVSALVLIALYVRHRHNSLDGDFQGWASASCMLMARAFNTLGAWSTHFVPFQNNLPVGLDPDVYLHWPPLYPLTLALALRVFGDTVWAGRVLALLIALAMGGVVFLIARHLYQTRVALLSVLFFFSSRAVFVGASPLLQQPLAMLFALGAVLCFLRACVPASDAAAEAKAERTVTRPRSTLPVAVLGGLLMMASVFCAWDPIFTPFGLLGTALWLRDRRAMRVSLAYCASACLAFALVEADYMWAYPRLFANQFATIGYRMGFHYKAESAVRLHTIVDSVHFEEQFGPILSYWRALKYADEYFSALTLAALILFVALWLRAVRSQRGAARKTAGTTEAAGTWLLGGLLLPGLVWYGLVRNYVAIHPFPLILFAPCVAIVSGYVLNRVWTWLLEPDGVGEERRGDGPLRVALLYGIPLLVLLPLLVEYRDTQVQQPPEFSSLDAMIEAGTPASAVVLTPDVSLVPTLYSRRHLVRGIVDDHWLREATADVHRDFPGTPIFFAMRDADRAKFSSRVAGAAQVARQGDATLYSLP